MAQDYKTKHHTCANDGKGGDAERDAPAEPFDDPAREVGSFVLNGHRFGVYCPGAVGAPEDPMALSVGMLFFEGRRCRIVEQTEHPHKNGRDPAEVLTARELQVATLVAHGHGTKRIAHRLCISEWTVQTHLRRIYAKLGVAGRAEMVFRCARRLMM